MLTQFDWIGKQAIYQPHKTAITEWGRERELTYGELNRLAEQTARWWIYELGLKSGDRVAMLAENSLEMVVLFSAAQKTGIILVPLNYRLACPELREILQNCEPKLLLTDPALRELGWSILEKHPLPHSHLEELLDGVGGVSLESPLPEIEFDQDHPIFILYTSGTTGIPKGVIYTHRMLLWNSLNTALRLNLTSDDRTLNFMPPFHTGGWNVLLTPFLHHGAWTCLMKQFDAGEVLQAMDQYRVTIAMGVPTMLKMMAECPNFESTDMEALRYMVVGGEPMPIPLIETWADKGVPVRQGFGMTEAGPNLFSLHQQDAIRKKGSIGQPNFYLEVKILDDDHQPVPDGQSGELCVRGAVVTPGYWENPTATATHIQDGWLHTGDMVIRDTEGYFFVVDRKKHMFISGGENVYPAEVERALRMHPAINEVVVVPIPHEKWGECGCAVVVFERGKQLSLDDIKAFAKTLLAGYKIPKTLHVVATLPKNATGKIDRRKLLQTVLETSHA
ncbi:long-chain fatty acid--CoA ligase [Pontibacter sp. G13]|uniref:class I adenylate-forming enzyme family protein n=1 Tax=Pontibacter sp. G13 TaxID=3074898 RepID=UPI00288B3673|nr:long-chain fatty acid--CoA ligase [Pontibacter sp. G13]WNJ20467.1 long-chain fatty acid--CoA ligase [Pontibacter sp. G13]